MQLPRILLFLLMCFLSAQSASAQGIQELILAQRRLFDGVTSYGYTIVQGSEDTGNFVKTTWREKGGKYSLDYINENKDGPGIPYRMTTSFDGVRGYRVDNDGRRLLIKNGPFSEFDRFRSPFSPLFPFEFLRRNADDRLTVESITAKAIAEVLGRATIESNAAVNVDGHSCIPIRIRNAYSRDSETPVSYLVFLAKDLGFFPVGWEVYDSKDGLMYSMLASEFIRSKGSPSGPGGFLYPKLMSISSDPVSKKGRTTIRNIEFAEVTMNQFDDDVFAMDPSTADYVEDLETNTLIAIPK